MMIFIVFVLLCLFLIIILLIVTIDQIVVGFITFYGFILVRVVAVTLFRTGIVPRPMQTRHMCVCVVSRM